MAASSLGIFNVLKDVDSCTSPYTQHTWIINQTQLLAVSTSTLITLVSVAGLLKQKHVPLWADAGTVSIQMNITVGNAHYVSKQEIET